MKSNWEESKKRSRYHFDPQRRDQSHEVIEHLGRLDPIWLDDIDEIVANSKPATWETRGLRLAAFTGSRLRWRIFTQKCTHS